jgi:hypothetical protein
MVVIEKHYFTLRETAARWALQADDMAYMAENGMLRLSVRLHGVHLERGHVEVEQGRTFHVPSERSWFTGLLDLTDRDAFLVFRSGTSPVQQFHVPGSEYAMLIEPTNAVTVRPEHLLIQRRERDRVEMHHGRSGHTVAEGIAFQHSDDFRSVRVAGRDLVFGALQASILHQLHTAASAGMPWCFGKELLAKAGANSQRMSDVFKSRPHWRDLIESDGRGRYRLKSTLR